VEVENSSLMLVECCSSFQKFASAYWPVVMQFWKNG